MFELLAFTSILPVESRGQVKDIGVKAFDGIPAMPMYCPAVPPCFDTQA
jgi:hypothetical protein